MRLPEDILACAAAELLEPFDPVKPGACSRDSLVTLIHMRLLDLVSHTTFSETADQKVSTDGVPAPATFSCPHPHAPAGPSKLNDMACRPGLCHAGPALLVHNIISHAVIALAGSGCCIVRPEES